MNKLQCKNCDGTNLITILRPDTPHFAEIRCDDCGKFLKWLSNPNKNNTIRNKSSKYKLESLIPNDFCWFCTRTKEQLGIREGLTIDHKKPIEEGGIDEISNLMVLCTACHKLKNWYWIYIKKHLVEKIENNEVEI